MLRPAIIYRGHFLLRSLAPFPAPQRALWKRTKEANCYSCCCCSASVSVSATINWGAECIAFVLRPTDGNRGESTDVWVYFAFFVSASLHRGWQQQGRRRRRRRQKREAKECCLVFLDWPRGGDSSLAAVAQRRLDRLSYPVLKNRVNKSALAHRGGRGRGASRWSHSCCESSKGGGRGRTKVGAF